MQKIRSTSKVVHNASFFQIAWPLVIAFTLGVILPIIDSFFLSRYSDHAAAAVGSFYPVYMAVVVGVAAFSQAGSNIAAQYIGSGHAERAGPTYLISLGMSVILGLMVSGLFYLFHADIGRWLGLEPEINQYLAEYVLIVGGGFVLKALQMNYLSILGSGGHTFLNMIGAVLMNIVNVSLNYVFLVGAFGLPKLGVSGVAVATLASLFVNIVFSHICLHYLVSVQWRVRWTFKHFKEIALPIYRIGWPSSLEPLSFQTFQIFVTAFVASLGTEILTTRVYLFNLVMITITMSMAIGTANQIMVAHMVGGKHFHKADRRVHQSIRFAASFALCSVAVVWFFIEDLLGLFTLNTEIISLGRSIFLIEFFLEPARAFNIILSFSLKASGDAKTPAFMGLLLMWTIGLASVFLLGSEYGLMGVWIGSALDEVVRAFYNYFRWRGGSWKVKGIHGMNLVKEEVSLG